MKEIAEAHLGTTITDAVISVPTHYNYLQRIATKNAATIAGLNVLQLNDESTLAAIAYGLDKKFAEERNVLVFNLGGGTCQVSLLTIEEGLFEVKATAGNAHLGGEDFDNRLVNHFVQDFKRSYRQDISSDARAIRRLRTACERAKRGLSSATKSSIEIDSLYDGIDFYTSLTRGQFEELCEDLFRNTLEPIEKVLRYSKIDKSDVHDVVLVGGSTRIPRILELVSNFFNGKNLSKGINPDESAAFGAAIQAAILSEAPPVIYRDVLLLDIVPMSLGIETDGGAMSTLIYRDTSMPTKKSKTFRAKELVTLTSDKDCYYIYIPVYEGECTRAKDNNFLGHLGLTCVSADDKVEIIFDVDAYMLNVSASNKGSGTSNHITIDSGHLSKEEIAHMTQEAEKYRLEDEAAKGCIASRNNLESYVYNLRDVLDANKNKLESAVDETIAWLDNSQRASNEEYESKQKELEGTVK